MRLHTLSSAVGSRRKRKRVGRGPGSGTGKTAGRGHKGQRSRSGYSRRLGFEGGQMPLIRRVPKRGFSNPFRSVYATVNLNELAYFEDLVTPELMVAKGLVRPGLPIKVLGLGEVSSALRIRAHRFSRSAREKIESAGGACEILT